MKYMFSCKDISKITSEDQKLSFFGKLKYKMHLFICHDCQNFVNSMREITKMVKKSIESKMVIEEMEVVRIENEILDKIKKRS